MARKRARKKTVKRGPPPPVHRTAVIPDAHRGSDLSEPRALDAACALLETLWLDSCVILGDWVDAQFVSTYASPNDDEDEATKNELNDARRGLEKLSDAVRRVNSDCKIYLIEGNHEFRFERYLRVHKHLRGMLDFIGFLGLENLNIEWVPFYTENRILRLEWSPGAYPTMQQHSIEEAHRMMPPDWGFMFIHGVYANMHSAKKHLERFNHGDLAFGHVHDFQAHTGWRWGKRKHKAYACGSLTNKDPTYNRPRPNNHVNGIGIVSVPREKPNTIVDCNLMQAGFQFYEIDDRFRLLFGGQIFESRLT